MSGNRILPADEQSRMSWNGKNFKNRFIEKDII